MHRGQREPPVDAVGQAHLLAFFDRDGDGHLAYNEFMRLLQDSKHQTVDAAASHVISRQQAAHLIELA